MNIAMNSQHKTSVFLSINHTRVPSIISYHQISVASSTKTISIRHINICQQPASKTRNARPIDYFTGSEYKEITR